jgi:hypothetical protein
MSGIYPPPSTGNSGNVDLSGLVPKERAVNEKPLENDIVLDLADFPKVIKAINDSKQKAPNFSFYEVTTAISTEPKKTSFQVKFTLSKNQLINARKILVDIPVNLTTGGTKYTRNLLFTFDVASDVPTNNYYGVELMQSKLIEVLKPLFVLNNANDFRIVLALEDKRSGDTIEVGTTEPIGFFVGV